MTVATTKAGMLSRTLLTATIALLCFDQAGASFAGRLLIPSDLIAVILIVTCSFVRLKGGRPKKEEIILLLYPSWSLVSALFSDNPKSALGACLTTIFLVLLCLSVRETCSRENGTQAFFTGWEILSWLVVTGICLGLLLFCFGLDTPERNYWLHIQGSLPGWIRPRLDGWFASPNRMCNVIILALGILLCRTPKNRSTGLIVALGFFSLFSFSSGLGAVWLLLAWSTEKRAWLGVTASLALVLLFINTFSYPHLRKGELAPSHRGQAWSQAGQHFLKNPITGSGPNQAKVLVVFNLPDGRKTRIAECHSLPLSLLSQQGLPSLMLFLGIVFLAAKNSHKNDRPLVVALLLSVGYHGLTGSFEDSRHLWIALGYLLRAEAPDQSELG